jgi:hypothetical protein
MAKIIFCLDNKFSKLCHKKRMCRLLNDFSHLELAIGCKRKCVACLDVGSPFFAFGQKGPHYVNLPQ